MSDCTERAEQSEGQEGMPSRPSMSDCTERAEQSEGQEGMPSRPSVSEIVIRPARFADPEVQTLVTEALADLGERYGGSSGDDTPVTPGDFDPPAGAFFVAVEGSRLVGCAGWRTHGGDAELKRMYTAPAARGRGLARRMLAVIEESARSAGRKRVILETGYKQPEAIALYESAGYERIEDFGFYKDYDGVLSYARLL